MLPPSSPSASAAIRRIGLVVWDHDGCRQLAVWARGEVPTVDDSILRGAFARCAHGCYSLAKLDRILNRELWSLGYSAFVEGPSSDDPVARVVIVGTR